MMEYKFTIQGHPNVRATHKSTLEFTKDSELTPKGDCIIGVGATFRKEGLKPFLAQDKVQITISWPQGIERITASPNPTFDDDKEMVIRISEFQSKRTFATRASKSSAQLDRKLIEYLTRSSIVTITISNP